MPVLHRRKRSGSPDDLIAIDTNLRRLVSDDVEEATSFAEAPGSLILRSRELSFGIVSPWHMNFERFNEMCREAFEGSSTLVLIDTELPRVSLWRNSGEGRASREACGLDAIIDLPEIKGALPLADLYAGLTFDVA